MNQKQAREELASYGMTLRCTDGEYRVTFKGWPRERAEAVAHYTDDIDDAVNTGRVMALQHAQTKHQTNPT
ncbi:hypothetical protein [Dyella silvatica]|uniref:hypothetical protein n=1 Tax=Dyella silvatica TaxID=2992128 RepID=UPI002255166F|nr:hypothetical protein [Dyella silvatica]